MNIRLSDAVLTRTTLEKYLPVVLAIGVAWLLGRGLKKLFWTGFGMYWALRFLH